jgi:hypothetical protein
MNMGPVSRSVRFVLLATALAFAGACGDDSDDGKGGEGGTGGGEPDSGTTGGTGGGGTGGGGTGGTGGSGDPCPDSNPNCAADVVTQVCETLVGCDLIPGAPLTQERCEEEVSEKCVDCSVATVGGDGGVADAAAVDCDTAAASDCQDVCGLLVSPPANKEECLDVSGASEGNTAEYSECVCTDCIDEFTACVGDDGCWLVVQCAAAVGCNGMSCYSPTACMAIIDEVGATSISVAMATELGNCTAMTCDALNN